MSLKTVNLKSSNSTKVIPIVAMGTLLLPNIAHAAVGIDYVIEKGLLVFAYCVGIAFLYAMGVGAFKLISAGLAVSKLKENNGQNPDMGRNLGIDLVQGLALIGGPAIVVMLIVSFFGSTEVVNFMIGSDGLSTNDMLNLQQGQNVGGTGTGTGN
ncbi:hypothetical protein AB4455_03585 [Vibrio sp. 10N.261.46.E12]|nr:MULTISPECIES: hypothetical protein [unclassified Vibrio]PMN84394.1 hypothetical protein BCT22_11265 [Vibrio sp. 10N.261.45.A1]OMO38356.1 hypothetical protein BH584_01695 [Vibrio sp. 10N.261.45.E1]PMJ19519.1 hypothetical protein BCU27_21500 [Vibrio sp. 10N.286.45.B6]PML84265.1 hypothetical protein BCT66_17715 [Vibrio sp. 10N.261.49.E11]PMM79811.1 hypothetical protein BCT46_19660 [Vibrio sp. 10N.261.46.E8]